MFGGATSKRVVIGGAFVYGLALVTSHCARSGQLEPTIVPPARTVSLHAISQDRTESELIRLAYRDESPRRASRLQPIVLVHGSPGRKEDFDRLVAILARDMRVIVPDLPGFGASTRQIPDYSFRAHAGYVRALLDALGVPRAHVLGYSMGGGVALNLIDIAPDRVASLTLLSAVGVQEMELTGDYYANHLVHGAQLAALWLLREGTPHLGRLDGAVLGVPYARNFFDSDQRPLRLVLEHVTAPTLIIHGREDPQVPIDAAFEHARLVPQSEMLTFDGAHMLVFSRAEVVADAVRSFVGRVADGTAPSRLDADPQRRVDAGLPFDSARLPRVRGIAALVFGGLVTVGAALLGSVANVAAGVFVARGRLAPFAALTACLLGGVPRLFRLGRSQSRTRGSSSVAAFLRYVVSTSLWVAASAALAWTLLRTPAPILHVPYLGFATVLCATAALLYGGVAASAHRRRRLLISKWRRLTRWEFWPPWAFYPPVFAYIACLMAKHRSLTLFTAANPSIVAGGVVGESKYDILQGLAGAGAFVARFELISGALPAGEKIRRAREFIVSNALGFPVVLKPNHGQRGSGVVIVGSAAALEQRLEQSRVDTIVQEYVTGEEFGVFYYRRPSEPEGHIFSITQKVFPSVVGDGKRTLERLILDDERAVCAAGLYCERHKDELETVLRKGRDFPLTQLGSHCRGALFLDGGRLLTPALTQRFDAIAKKFEGFFFGRFDVRATAGLEQFRSGEGFKILELNGVTSEATHIYHPGTPLAHAYGVLMEQWRIAFEIGAENRERGVSPTPLRRLCGLALDYRRTARGHLVERHDHTVRQ